MEDVASLISTIGFPAAAFVAMWYMCNSTLKEMRESIDKLGDRITQGMARIGGD